MPWEESGAGGRARPETPSSCPRDVVLERLRWGGRWPVGQGGHRAPQSLGVLGDSPHPQKLRHRFPSMHLEIWGGGQAPRFELCQVGVSPRKGSKHRLLWSSRGLAPRQVAMGAPAPRS